MPAPTPPEVVTAILADIRAGGMSCRGIADKHGRAPSTVARIAKANGLTFERAQTENATRARTSDMAARRAELAELLLEDAFRLRQRAWQPYQVVVNTSDGPTVVQIDKPPLRDTQAAYTAVAIPTDKHAKLDKHDSDGGAEKAKGIVGALVEGLRAAADALPPEAT
ncbi:MAG: hypothetical protein HOQ43_10855 [Glycomyces artemisiae]|uniref:Uncharacterized protein n=1 Tax=Glycomyces artemisiae TaxID=1076443 RepID=A0A850C4L5_9ACTN|nr:hypothetical protein [Glycomyces artemisiae]